MKKIFGWLRMVKHDQSTEDVPVEVMAIAYGYAMVRRKGCAPFIVNFSELEGVK